MFTGIITDIGEVISATPLASDLRLRIATRYDANDLTLGESIACSGCCLTVIERGTTMSKNWFDVTLSPETLRVTAPRWQMGSKLNLERALCLGDRLGGHMVSGHVDGLARLISLTPLGESHELTLEAPASLSRYIAAKGSVTLDGISLTVNSVENHGFTINIIPHTWQETTLGTLREGDTLNLEIDLIARYLERMTQR